MAAVERRDDLTFRDRAHMVEHYRAVKARLRVGMGEFEPREKPRPPARERVEARGAVDNRRPWHTPVLVEVSRRPRPEVVLRVVAARSGVPLLRLRSSDRRQRLVDQRHLAMYLLRKMGLSFPEVGRHLGGRDHTTALYGFNRVSKRVREDEEFAAMVAEVEADIESRLKKQGSREQ